MSMVMLDTRVRVARLMVDYVESGAVKAELTINLSSRSEVALGQPLPSCPPILVSIFYWPHYFDPYNKQFSDLPKKPAYFNPMI
ncbi:hypothetical protein TNCV_30781 [Trichonephila clavipes]|nr:hypothetical protein TNCV_30781 [Trichonephila clavipes]